MSGRCFRGYASLHNLVQGTPLRGGDGAIDDDDDDDDRLVPELKRRDPPEQRELARVDELVASQETVPAF